jgi:hypothetical protein
MVDGPAVDVALDAADPLVSADVPCVVVGLHLMACGAELRRLGGREHRDGGRHAHERQHEDGGDDGVGEEPGLELHGHRSAHLGGARRLGRAVPMLQGIGERGVRGS